MTDPAPLPDPTAPDAAAVQAAVPEQGASPQPDAGPSQAEASREVILYYKYVELGDDEAVKRVGEEQRRICAELGLSGRMRIAGEGINGTLAGPAQALERYQAHMEDSELFKGIQYKWSRVSKDMAEDPFNGELAIKYCSEITSTGPMKRSKPTALGGKGGTHLRPAEFHAVVKQAEQSDDIVVVDTRNYYETAVGSFRGAIDPKIRNFAQFPAWVDANKEKLRGKHVAMFCTGGIRCEKASAYVKSLGIAKEVSQLEGGIHSYLEAFSAPAKELGVRTKKLSGGPAGEPIPRGELEGSDCLFDGINFQFDNRFSKPEVGESGAVYHAAKCLHCGKPHTETRKDVVCAICKDFVLLCDKCVTLFDTSNPAAIYPPGSPLPSNVIRCFEHQLLDDDWKALLGALNLPSDALVKHVCALRAMEAQCVGRGKQKRRRTLGLQAERLEELLESRGASDALQKALAEQKTSEWIPFVPAFEWESRRTDAIPAEPASAS